MLEATQRIKRRDLIVNRKHADNPDARFVMSLSNGEMVLLDQEGVQVLLVLKTKVSTSGQLRFVLHTDARLRVNQKIYTATASTLNACKVTVDSLGRIRWAND